MSIQAQSNEDRSSRIWAPRGGRLAWHLAPREDGTVSMMQRVVFASRAPLILKHPEPFTIVKLIVCSSDIA